MVFGVYLAVLLRKLSHVYLLDVGPGGLKAGFEFEASPVKWGLLLHEVCVAMALILQKCSV